MKICFVIIIAFLFSGISYAAEEKIADPFPNVAAAYLLKINGKVIWAHNPDRKLPPASLTKIMTALIVLEKADMQGVVSVSKTAANETGTRIGLKQGDRMLVMDLLAASLLQSANDACRALAEHVAGSQEKFTAMMNLKAKQIGMKNTRFMNACGHDQKGFYSTANDLAVLAETALQNKVFANLVSLIKGKIATIDNKRTFTIENKNELAGRYQGTIGVKTGFTLNAGKCLIALVERSGTKVLLVMLNAPDRWWDAVSILDKAFALQNQQPDAGQ